MKIRYLNSALLVLTLAVSFFSVLRYTIGFDRTEGQNDSYDFLIPGVVYSFFIIWVIWSKGEDYPLHKLILFFPVLILVYCAAVICGLQSWGVAVPVIGGVGALLIKKLFYWNTILLDDFGKAFAVLGSVAGLAGFLLFLWAKSNDMDGVGFGCILVTWQAAFEIKWIWNKELTP